MRNKIVKTTLSTKIVRRTINNPTMPKRFIKMKQAGEKIAALTAYDATFATAVAAVGVDLILVGDSLGMVVKGEKDTLAVRLSEVGYHVRAVTIGAPEFEELFYACQAA